MNDDIRINEDKDGGGSLSCSGVPSSARPEVVLVLDGRNAQGRRNFSRTVATSIVNDNDFSGRSGSAQD